MRVEGLAKSTGIKSGRWKNKRQAVSSMFDSVQYRACNASLDELRRG